MTGKVASVERFGIFVELVDGLEGLLHISEINKHERTEAPDLLYRKYRIGDPIDVRVLDITPHEHRIALGLPNSHSHSYVST